MKNKVKKQLNNYYRRKKIKAKDINIPFKIHDRGYNPEEERRRDAVMLETLQRIANALEDVSDKLNTTSKKSGGK